MTTVFSRKLDDIPATVDAALAADASQVGAALGHGLARVCHAVGSGGSAIAAQFLATCRDGLGGAPTLVRTPLQFVLDHTSLVNQDVWLFSAGGANADILGALRAAVNRGAGAIHIVTVNPEAPLAATARATASATVHVTLTSGASDGFLATHSLVAALTQLLRAADGCAHHPRGGALVDEWRAEVRHRLSAENRSRSRDLVPGIKANDTLFILEDPRLDAAALLLETCAWEAALCAVQRTDFRNFAHGRHVWLNHRGEDTFLLALLGFDTAEVWLDLERHLPPTIRRATVNYGGCGRFEAACAVLDGLVLIEVLGHSTGVDPGRPGAATFAEHLYEATSLTTLSDQLNWPVRQKRSALNRADAPDGRETDLCERQAAFVERLGAAHIRAVVLDYDGTLVELQDREAPLSAGLTAEIRRLLDEGLILAVATGRGGSAGDQLRKVVPEQYRPSFWMSYYNGALTLPLSDVLDGADRVADPRLDPVRAWLSRTPDLAARVRDSQVQLGLEAIDIPDFEQFEREFDALNVGGELRLTRSAQTVDICPADACKSTLVRDLARQQGVEVGDILCLGDSGGHGGNDFSLLGLPSGVSVGQVCDRPDTSWTLFTADVQGPAAVQRILSALRKTHDGHRLAIGELCGS
ncbi:MAG: hypothetical protein EON59_01915 [Alphaproteobacteria bacterium]|nr:MAG: hypothetical protein EON59_01915 [Alphaproteobacteria bacterium]